MNYRRYITAATLASVALLSSCGGKVKETVDPYPSWYYTPNENNANALNSASCVTIPGGNMELARKKALVNGRADLAGQIETRVKAMDKAYSSVATTNLGDNIDSTFESVTKQVSNQVLTGVRAIKSVRINDGGKPFFCSLVSLDPNATKELLDTIFKSSGAKLSSDEESVLRARFLAAKAQTELEEETKRQ